MSFNSTLADFISSWKVGTKHRSWKGSCKYSTMNEKIIKILIEKKYILDYKIVKYSIHYSLNKIKYIQDIKQISKPSCRIYLRTTDLREQLLFYRNGMISTDRGLMMIRDAIKNKIGGEILFIYK